MPCKQKKKKVLSLFTVPCISYWQAGLGIVHSCSVLWYCSIISFLFWRKFRYRPLFCPATSPRFWSILRGGSGRGTPPSPQFGAGRGAPPSPRGGASIPGIYHHPPPDIFIVIVITVSIILFIKMIIILMTALNAAKPTFQHPHSLYCDPFQKCTAPHRHFTSTPFWSCTMFTIATDFCLMFFKSSRRRIRS